MSKPTIPLYEQKRQRVAGVQAVLKTGDDAQAKSATWLIAAASLAGLVPKVGDRCRGTDGVWRVVQEVGPLADGAFPCRCDRDGEPA